MKRLLTLLLCLWVLAGVLTTACSNNTSGPSTAEGEPPNVTVSGPSLSVQEIDSPAGEGSREPSLFSTPDGRAILSWVQKLEGNRYALRFVSRVGNSWSEPSVVAEGDNWFVNWADFPQVIAAGGDSLAAHWLVKSGSGTYAYDVNVARSNDGGKTWGNRVVPHTDGTRTEHGFVSLLPLPDGRVGAVWLDGRNLKDVSEDAEEGSPLPVSMTLRYAAIDAAGRLSGEALLDERVCECCQTSAAVLPDGAIAVYRDRSEREVRDIYFVRLKDGKWDTPRPVHTDGWEVSGCPVNGPAISAEGSRAAVAWYTEAGDGPHVNVAFYKEDGSGFGRPVRVDDGRARGRVDVEVMPDGSALVCWLAGADESGAIKIRSVMPGGQLGPVTLVAQTDTARSSGFPRMARLGNEVLIAWTQFGKPSRVRTALVRVDAAGQRNLQAKAGM